MINDDLPSDDVSETFDEEDLSDEALDRAKGSAISSACYVCTGNP
jgi:hypothetical protein